MGHTEAAAGVVGISHASTGLGAASLRYATMQNAERFVYMYLYMSRLSDPFFVFGPAAQNLFSLSLLWLPKHLAR